MKFEGIYETLQKVAIGPVVTLVARDRESNQKVIVHTFEYSEQAINQPGMRDVLSAFSAVAPQPVASVVDAGKFDGTPIAYLVISWPGDEALAEWVRIYKAGLEGNETSEPPGPATAIFGSDAAGTPTTLKARSGDVPEVPTQTARSYSPPAVHPDTPGAISGFWGHRENTTPPNPAEVVPRAPGAFTKEFFPLAADGPDNAGEPFIAKANGPTGSHQHTAAIPVDQHPIEAKYNEQSITPLSSIAASGKCSESFPKLSAPLMEAVEAGQFTDLFFKRIEPQERIASQDIDERDKGGTGKSVALPDHCQNCGAVIAGGEQVCGNCGERLWLPQRPEGMTVFYSYSHKDEDLREELERHLAALRRSGLIRDWHDRKIIAGHDWNKELSRHLESAQIVLFLISADFMASTYISDIEVTRALARQRSGDAVVVPVILRPVQWNIVPEFSRLQALPEGGRPVTDWSSRDSAFVSICEGILAVVVSRAAGSHHQQAEGRSSDSLHRPQTASRRRRRILDAALPARVPIAKPSTLLVMVRRKNSPGLRAIVEADPNSDISEKDIDSHPLTLEFPTDKNRTPQSLDLTIRIESPQFEPKFQIKNIRVPPRGDSEARVFLLTPIQGGPLVVNLEICRGDEIVAGCVLRTQGVPSEEELPPSQCLASASLPVSSDEEDAVESGVPEERGAWNESKTSSDTTTGEFTSFFRGPFSGEQPAPSPRISVDSTPLERIPGDFTRVFGSSEKDASSKPQPFRDYMAPNSATQQGSSTEIFEPQVTPAPNDAFASDWQPRQASSAAPRDFTRPADRIPNVVPSQQPAAEPPQDRDPFLVTRPVREPGPMNPLPDPASNATRVFSSRDAGLSMDQPAEPTGPSQWTMFQSSEKAAPVPREDPPVKPDSQRQGWDSLNPAVPSPATPAIPSVQAPAIPSPVAPQVPISMQPPAMPAPSVPVLSSQAAPAPKPAFSYWPLVIVLNVLFIIAVLLVLYFALKH